MDNQKIGSLLFSGGRANDSAQMMDVKLSSYDAVHICAMGYKYVTHCSFYPASGTDHHIPPGHHGASYNGFLDTSYLSLFASTPNLQETEGRNMDQRSDHHTGQAALQTTNTFV